MADLKISQLGSIVTVVPATDVLPVVQGGTTYKVTPNQLLGAGGTANLASATISGDLTVRTTGLILNTSGLGVGITPTSFGAGYGTIQVSGSTGSGFKMGSPTNGAFIYSDNTFLNILTETNIPHRFFVNNLQQHRIEALGVFTWLDGAGGTRMTLNSTGLGVGGSPDTGLFTVGATTVTSATTPAVKINSNKAVFLITSDGATNAAGTTINYSWANGGQGPLIFRNAAIANVMTLDASGNLLVTRTSAGLTNGTGVTIGQSSIGMQTEGNATQIVVNRTTADGTIVDIRRQNVTVGSISVTTTATTYNTSSDYRLKESAQPLVGGLARVNALKPSVYKWKANGSAGEGFLAHELAEVVPFAVTGDKDAVDADGKPAYQGVDLSKVVPILVAAIKELTARVQTLEAR